MTTKEVLLAAADHIEKVGHHKHRFYNRDAKPDASYKEVPCCVYGAIKAVNNGQSWGVSSAMKKFLGLGDHAPAGHTDSLIAWNDAPERTGQEVIDALRACASSAVAQ